MIGAPGVPLAVATILLVLGAFGMRSADPRIADAPVLALAERDLERRAVDAAAAIDQLAAALEQALGEGRRGAARTVAGAEPPGEPLEAAAAILEAAAGAAGRAGVAVDELRRPMATLLPRSPVIRPPSLSAELASIADQLRDAAPAADEFAAMRRLMQGSLERLEAAFIAFDRGDLEAAREATVALGETLATLRAWEIDLQTLPIWLGTMGALRDALDRAARAALAGDEMAVAAALGGYQAAADEAREADVALGIAVAEGGAAVSATPLRRLADSVAATEMARQAVASVLHTLRQPSH